MYYMVCTESGSKMVRVKGASKQTHEHLTEEDFSQKMDRSIYANRYRLGPTRGHDMAIRFESRKIISSFNGKRRCEVNNEFGRTFSSFSLPPLPICCSQDPVHSHPL